MSTYIPAYKGYIADVPLMWFKRCDGQVFYYDELTDCRVQPEVNQTEINAGWSLYPTAYIPGQSTMTINITSGQFNADLFAMANDVEFEQQDIEIPETDMINIDALLVQQLGQTWTEFRFKNFKKYNSANVQFMDDNGDLFGDEIEATSINDLANQMKELFSVDNALTVNYPSDDVAIQLSSNTYGEYSAVCVYEGISYQGMVAKIDNKKVAIGEAVLKWPVYASGEDCSDSAIKGYLSLRLFRCRITQLPGFDSSYKSAGTYSVELSAMDPKRDDGLVYALAYFDSWGNDIAPSAGGTKYWADGYQDVTFDGITITGQDGVYTIDGVADQPVSFLLNAKSGIVGFNGTTIPSHNKAFPTEDTAVTYTWMHTDGESDGSWYLYGTDDGMEQLVDYWDANESREGDTTASYNVSAQTPIVITVEGTFQNFEFYLSVNQ